MSSELSRASLSSITGQIVVTQQHNFKVEILTKQKDVIWGFDFVSENKIIFTERSSALKILDLKTKKMNVISGGPQVLAAGQGGLLDVALNPKDKTQVYLTYAFPYEKGKSVTALGVGSFKEDKLLGFKLIFKSNDANSNTIHFGSRVVFDNLGNLYLSIGDRDKRDKAQSLDSHNGKILRLKSDGTAASGNPFLKVPKAQPEIWSLGHRNPQGLAYDSETDSLWEAEFGPRGGDELNLIQSGENYGWPKVTYGREYWGPSIGVKKQKGFVEPIAYWVPSISPSGVMLYRGSSFKKWTGNIFLANLSSTHIRRLKIENNKVIEQEELLSELGTRFRQIKAGPNGHIYFSTDNGELGRLIPALK